MICNCGACGNRMSVADELHTHCECCGRMMCSECGYKIFCCDTCEDSQKAWIRRVIREGLEK